MKLSNMDRAGVLAHALPYIKEYKDKIVVVKYGGNAMLNLELQNAVMRDIVLLSLIGVKVVLVHGGGPEISDMLKRVGKESRFINGLRHSDAETVEIVQMVLSGKVNKGLVSLLHKAGGKAVGMSGVDGGMIDAKILDPDLGFVGEITGVKTDIITDMLNNGYIPVISSVAGDKEGNIYNINADTAASEIAAALKAEALITLTDIRGLLIDKDDESTLIPVVPLEKVPELIESGVISGGMIPKVDCCINAVNKGVKRVFIIDGRVKHSIIVEMLTDEGIGTMFIADMADADIKVERVVAV